MLKYLFFDQRDYEHITGFERRLERPRKLPENPIYLPTAPWEKERMSFYGSVIRRADGLFQCWYTTESKLGYLESDDGLQWRRPLFDIFKSKGQKTNIVFTLKPHGACVIYDQAETRPGWRYKMLAGAELSQKICAFISADGITWRADGVLPAGTVWGPYNPVIGTYPDCPISLYRAESGLYVAYHRPANGDRRVARSESWDFRYWTPARMVLEPGPGDPPNLEFYGMGATPYGPYDLGTVWAFRTEHDDTAWCKMEGYQEAELAYSRGGYAWHRAARGETFIPHGRPGSWEQGQVQCASSAVLCEDEVRFYYAGTRVFHTGKGGGKGCRSGMGVAVTKPDRFIGLHAGARPGEIVSRIFWIRTPEFFVNADIARDGYVTLEVLDAKWKRFKGCISKPIAGNGSALRVVWSGSPRLDDILKKPLRFRLKAKKAKVYSVWMRDGDAKPLYYRFRVPGYRFVDMNMVALMD